MTWEVCELHFGNSDNEMELEVEDDDNEEYIDINESRITYGGDDNLLDKTNLQGDHMDEAEEENNEIDSHPAQRHFTTTNEESNEPTDISNLDEGNFSKE